MAGEAVARRLTPPRRATYRSRAGCRAGGKLHQSPPAGRSVTVYNARAVGSPLGLSEIVSAFVSVWSSYCQPEGRSMCSQHGFGRIERRMYQSRPTARRTPRPRQSTRGQTVVKASRNVLGGRGRSARLIAAMVPSPAVPAFSADEGVRGPSVPDTPSAVLSHPPRLTAARRSQSRPERSWPLPLPPPPGRQSCPSRGCRDRDPSR